MRCDMVHHATVHHPSQIRNSAQGNRDFIIVIYLCNGGSTRYYNVRICCFVSAR